MDNTIPTNNQIVSSNLTTQKETPSRREASNKLTSSNIKNMNTLCHNFDEIIPQSIDKKHWEEWLDSGVESSIIQANVKTIYDAWEVDKLLNRNSKKRWKHSDSLVPCWAVTGVDPLTDEPTALGCQVKPDVPLVNKNGKAQKYISASEYDAAPLFLKTDINNYWASVIGDKTKPVIITEGAKKAGAGLTIGYPTISMPGVSTCRKSGRLHDLLKLFTGFGRIFYLCFDNDISYKRPVQNALLSLARDLSATGSKLMVIKIPLGKAKGMDDFIDENGKEEFDKLIGDALTIEEWRKEIEDQWQQQQSAQVEEEKLCPLAKQFQIVKQGWGEAIKLNKLKNIIEMAGFPLELDDLRFYLSLEFNQQIAIADAQSMVRVLARQNAYNPVVDYLDSVAQQYPQIDTSIIGSLATRYFGSDNELHNIYMRKTLVAAVKRARKPGCKHDCATILVGKQGAFKSTFWKELFGEDWFSDGLGEANEKDDLMKMHSFWCLEWSEFENVYKRKDVSSLKKFMSASADTYRAPYARTPVTHPRMSILVGTTNETDILSDPSGSRRFWIIPIQKKIPIALLKEERDKLWAAANALYEAGEDLDLTEEQHEQREILNLQYQIKDPWHRKVELYVDNRNYVTTEELLTHLEIEISRQDVGMVRRISGILRRLGWEQGRHYVCGERMRVWLPKKSINLSVPSVPSNSQGSNSASTPRSTSTETEVLKVENTEIQQEIFASKKFGNLSVPSVPSVPSLQNQPETTSDDVSTKKGIKVAYNNQLLSQNSEITETHVTQSNLSVPYESMTTQESQPIISPNGTDGTDKFPNFFEKDEKNTFSKKVLDAALSNQNEPTIETLVDDTSTQGQGFSVLSQVKVKFASAIGDIKAIATKTSATTYDIQLLLPNGFEKLVTRKASSEEQAKSQIKREVKAWKNSLTFSVQQFSDEVDEYIWIEGCKCTSIPCAHTHDVWYRFQTPTGKNIQVRGDFEFKLEG